MSATTLVVPAEALAAAEWRIGGDAHHHLFRVKRLAPGDVLRLTDGGGHARFAEVVAISKRESVVRLAGEAPANEPALAVELFVAPPKSERAAWLVEKATEVGVAAIRFLTAERGARAFGPAQLERLRRVGVAAVEQCGRSRVPEIATAAMLAEVLGKIRSDATPVWALDVGPQRRHEGLGCPRVALLVGPEGGWGPSESELFDRFAVPRWSLGERILRVETAAVVAAGILLAARLDADT